MSSPTSSVPRSWLNGPLLVTVIFWAYNFTAAKLVFREIAVPAVTLTRTFLAYGFFFAVILYGKGKLRTPPGNRWRYLLQGFLANGIYMVAFMEGLKRSNPAQAAIIMATSPMAAAMLAIVAGQDRFRWSILIGTIVAFCGVAISELGGGSFQSGEWIGSALIFGAAMVWSGGVLIMKPLLGESTPVEALFYALPGSLIALVPYGIASTLHQDWASISVNGWLLFLFVGIASGGIAFVTYYKGMQQLGTARATMYQYLVPPSAALIQWAVLGKAINVWQGAGLILALAGVIIGSSRKPAALETKSA